MEEIEARLAVLEVLVCHTLAKADPDLAVTMEDWFRSQAEHLVTQAPADRTAWAGLRLSQTLAREIAASLPPRTG